MNVSGGTLSLIIGVLLWTLISAKRGDSKIQFPQKGHVIQKGNDREARIFSLFNIVQFSNEGCTSATSLTSGSSGQNRNGTCYTSAECSSKGGMASGNCAAGFGVCCLFIVMNATSSISQNCTYIQNPGFPMAYAATTSIAYMINKCTQDVCYLRLDFGMFTILGIGAATACQDTFIVTTPGSSLNYPTICGQNTGQHIFLDLGAGASNPATLTFTFLSPLPASTTIMRNWDIKVTQYKCGDPNAPPEGCLQYQTGYTGRFTTFNFLPTADNHLPNQQYSVCIRQENGFCCVQYQVCPDVAVTATTNPGFSLSAPATMMAMFDAACLGNDYIGIADSSSQCNEGLNNVGLRSRYCGGFFNDVMALANAPICDCTSPFSVEVFANNLGTPTPGAQGVCLVWMQLPCTG